MFKEVQFTFLRLLARFILWIFFRRIDVRGVENVPEADSDSPASEALLVAANHPNVLLDIFLVGVFLPRTRVRFIGKSTLFNQPLFGWILRRLGVIPVSRAQDLGQRMSSNRDMFREAVQTLTDGGSIIIFPEGLSHTHIKVQTLKAGAAHIALTAASDGLSDLQILPVGLTYLDPEIFRSDVEVHFGKPIEVKQYVDAWARNRHEAEKELTALIHERITSLTRHVEDSDLETVVRDLSAIYAEEVTEAMPDTAELSARLRAEQGMIRAVRYFTELDPDLVQSVALRLRTHLRKLKRLHLEPEAIPTHGSVPGAGRVVLAALLSPIGLYGFPMNAIPYYLPRLFAIPYRRTFPQSIATVKVSAGIILFASYYLVWGAILFLSFDFLTALLVWLTLPLSGLFTLYYHEQFLQALPLWRSMIMPRRRRYVLRRLVRERARIIRDLDEIKSRYVERPHTST